MRLAPFGVSLLVLAAPARTDDAVRVVIASVAAATNDEAARWIAAGETLRSDDGLSPLLSGGLD